MLDSREPAVEFLDGLADDDLADVLIRFEKFARTGTLQVPNQLKEIEQYPPIWQIKTPRVRLPFYYRDDHPGIQAIRLTNGFFKLAQWAAAKHFRFAQRRVREEDLHS